MHLKCQKCIGDDVGDLKYVLTKTIFFLWSAQGDRDSRETEGFFESPFLTTLELTRHENGVLERQEPTRERVRGPRFSLPTCWGVGWTSFSSYSSVVKNGDSKTPRESNCFYICIKKTGSDYSLIFLQSAVSVNPYWMMDLAESGNEVRLWHSILDWVQE
jgi:hypothetical protein